MNDVAFKCKWVLAFLLFSGCAHRMEISPQTMQQVDSMAVGKSFWLKQSLYMGQFYDDERYFLLHPRSFDELTYVQMPDGKTVAPPQNQQIIPVGTRVLVTNIEWPSFNNYLNRPLFTPRDLPWMKLQVALARGQVSLMRDKAFIIILPPISNENHFKTWLSSILSLEDTNPWFLGLSEATRTAVSNKKIAIGMSEEAMLASLGEPDSLSKDAEEDEDGKVDTRTIAIYAKQILVLENGFITKIQTLTPSTPAQFHSARGGGNR